MEQEDQGTVSKCSISRVQAVNCDSFTSLWGWGERGSGKEECHVIGKLGSPELFPKGNGNHRKEGLKQKRDRSDFNRYEITPGSKWNGGGSRTGD